MSLAAPELEWAVRLSGQIKTLSELAESLTFRLLELEERLASQENELAAFQLASDQLGDAVARAMDERLGETEDRLVRLEALLRQEEQRSAPSPALHAVSKPAPLVRPERLSQPEPPLGKECLDPPHGETVFDDDLLFKTNDLDDCLAS